MSHQPNPKHLPPKRSNREYEAEIARLRRALEDIAALDSCRQDEAHLIALRAIRIAHESRWPDERRMFAGDEA